MNSNGQVSLQSEFGQLLTTYAQMPEIEVLLEVGTWKGNGTTACIVAGIQQKVDKDTNLRSHFYSLEANLKFYREAHSLWLPKGLPYLQLLYGRLHKDGLLPREEIENHPLFESVQSHYRLWYDQDTRDYNSAPLIESKYLPKQIHMLVLDGGEFSGYADWVALKEKNPIVIALDDTNVIKNAKVYEELMKDNTWEKRHGTNERHGWAIFVRKGAL